MTAALLTAVHIWDVSVSSNMAGMLIVLIATACSADGFACSSELVMATILSNTPVYSPLHCSHTLSVGNTVP